MLCKIRPIISQKNSKEKKTLLFAAQELQKYLTAVSDGDFSIIPTKEQDCNETNAIYLGVNLCAALPAVENRELDDAIYIDVKNYSGIITGSNVRSVLIGVYRFLKEIGFVFLHPGKNGEKYPQALPDKEVFVCEKASYRHRCICSEGSIYQKCFTDTIDWIPKAAMNGYYTQFTVPKPFLTRWYLENTPYRDKTDLSVEDMQAILDLAEEEIEKRSLIYHAVGHGWLSNAFHIPSYGWDGHEEPEPQYRHLLALLNGERKLWLGRPLNTNLCFSKPVARDEVTDSIVEYCKTHKNISYLHFWLADGTNNNCECEECRKLRVADWYIMMLNELDQKLTAEGIDTKIAFIVYVDAFWKPIRERLKDNERFLLVYAPIFRSFSTSFDPDSKGEMKPYVLNKLEFPVEVADNLEYLKDWKQDFDCDSVDFDYHFVWDHYIDFPQYNHAKILSEDIKNLDKIGLNGLINCQVQRTFLPSSLSMNVMAETLWNKEAEFEAIAGYVLSNEFGEAYQKVQEYLSLLSEYGCAKEFRGEVKFTTPECIANLQHSIEILEQFNPVIQKEKNIGNKRIASAWEKIAFFAKLYRLVLDVALNVAKGGEIEDISHINDLALQYEVRLKEEFDAAYFWHIFNGRMKKALVNSQNVSGGVGGVE